MVLVCTYCSCMVFSVLSSVRDNIYSQLTCLSSCCFIFLGFSVSTRDALIMASISKLTMQQKGSWLSLLLVSRDMWIGYWILTDISSINTSSVYNFIMSHVKAWLVHICSHGYSGGTNSCQLDVWTNLNRVEFSVRSLLAVDVNPDCLIWSPANHSQRLILL